MLIPTRQEMIGKMRSLLILAGEIMMMIALSPLSVDAAEVVPGPAREKDIEETCEENEPSARKRGNSSAGGIIAEDKKIQRSEIQPDQVTTGQVLVEKASTGGASLRAETARTMVPIPVIINNYRRALEAYLILVSTLLPEPCLAQRALPHTASILSPATPVTDSLSSAGLSPPSPYNEEPSYHSKLRAQRAVFREPARSVPYIDPRAYKKDRSRTGIALT